MKKSKFFVLLLALLILISGCAASPNVTPSANIEQTFDVNQFNEWKSQAEEITPLLEASLYGIYDVDLRTCIHKRLSKVWTWEILTIASAEETEIS